MEGVAANKIPGTANPLLNPPPPSRGRRRTDHTSQTSVILRRDPKDLVPKGHPEHPAVAGLTIPVPTVTIAVPP